MDNLHANELTAREFVRSGSIPCQSASAERHVIFV
jgi:hypothetical protein